MILNPIRGNIRPIFCSTFRQIHTLRPTIKIGNERFQLTLDVRQFNIDEIKVKAHPEYVVIEGKQEKTTQQGYVMRQFVRRFKLPEGCIPQKIESKLSPEGMLTITVPRTYFKKDVPSDTVFVPISYGPSDAGKIEEKPPEDDTPRVNPCAAYPKVIPCKKKEVNQDIKVDDFNKIGTINKKH